MDLAQIVSDAADFKPVALWINHPPPGQIIDCGAPQDRLFSTCIHRDVAADARGLPGCGIDRKNITGTVRSLCHTLGDHAGLGVNYRHIAV